MKCKFGCHVRAPGDLHAEEIARTLIYYLLDLQGEWMPLLFTIPNNFWSKLIKKKKKNTSIQTLCEEMQFNFIEERLKNTIELY